jgi:hypothetical protein
MVRYTKAALHIGAVMFTHGFDTPPSRAMPRCYF